jgi:hypothetical protein
MGQVQGGLRFFPTHHLRSTYTKVVLRTSPATKRPILSTPSHPSSAADGQSAPQGFTCGSVQPAELLYNSTGSYGRAALGARGHPSCRSSTGVYLVADVRQ